MPTIHAAGPSARSDMPGMISVAAGSPRYSTYRPSHGAWTTTSTPSAPTYHASARQSRRPTYHTTPSAGCSLRAVATARPTAPARRWYGTSASSATTAGWTLPLMSCWAHAPTRSTGNSNPNAPAERYASQIGTAVASAIRVNQTAGTPRIGISMASSGGYRYWKSSVNSSELP